MVSSTHSTIIDRYKGVVIQIATPYSVGTGFYLAEHDLIVTNEHVVRDNREIVIDGEFFDRQLVEVLYLDELHDLAFLKAPRAHEMPSVGIRKDSDLYVGEIVLSLGHPFGQNYQFKEGRIDSVDFEEDEIQYYEHSALLSPGNSGGPLFDQEGYLLGVNTFLIRSGQEIGYSLPLTKLKEALQIYSANEADYLIKCGECKQVIVDPEGSSRRCTHCGTKIGYISHIPLYEPIGINKQIEEMLSELNHSAILSRRGPYNWEVEQGSALIHVAYHEKSGLITGDAHLCTIPDDDILPLYSYLLKANYELEGLSFTVRDNEVILSLLIFDQYLNKLTALRLFEHLFKMADHYDDILVDDFNAKWLTF